jgi:hypothetical protein
MTKERPEALAELAESARHPDEVAGKKGKKLTADENTTIKPEDNAIKHDAAEKVLREGATGQDQGADEAVKQTQDRIIESR